MKDTLIDIKNNLQGKNSSMKKAENQINHLEHKEGKKQPVRTARRKKRIKKKNEDSINSLWENFKRSNICIIGVQGGEKKEQKIGNPFEKIMK